MARRFGLGSLRPPRSGARKVINAIPTAKPIVKKPITATFALGGLKNIVSAGPQSVAGYGMKHTGMKSRHLAGKGKYIAGAVAGGYAVGGVTRNTRGADKAVGRPTGIYGF